MARLMFFDGTNSLPTVQDELDASFIPAGQQGTNTAITSIPSTINAGANLVISGTVKKSSDGSAVAGGTVQVQYQATDGSWVNRSTPVTVSGTGTWTLTTTQTTRTIVWRAVYQTSTVSGTVYLTSTSPTKTVTALQETTFTKTYNCTGSGSFQGDGDKRSGIVELYQGYYSSTNGNQRSVAAFNDATIRADLAGATINSIQLYLNALHWGDSGGGTAVIGTISTSGVPASNPSTANADRKRQAWDSKTGGKWVTLPNSVGDDFKSGAAKAILIGPGPTTNTLDYYGYFAGNGQTGEPQLKISYSKWA